MATRTQAFLVFVTVVIGLVFGVFGPDAFWTLRLVLLGLGLVIGFQLLRRASRARARDASKDGG